MKWRYFGIILVVFGLVVLNLVLIGIYSKDTLNYDSRQIETIDDVRVFLEECKQKFGLNCEKLLLDKLEELER